MTTITRLTQIAVDAAKRKDALLIERGIGYWITADGEYLPTPPRVSHADFVRQWFENASLNDDEQDALTHDANVFAIDRGWSRVRAYPNQRVVYIDYGRNMQAQHAKLLDDLLDQLGLVGYDVKYTDEDSNYVSP